MLDVDWIGEKMAEYLPVYCSHYATLILYCKLI